MDDHSGGLVHNEQGVVLVDDRDWNVLSGYRALLHLRDLDSHHVARRRAITRLLPPPVHEDMPLSDQGRRLRARELRPLGNKEIEADIAVRLDRKLFDFAQT